nr:hypothetical protein [Aquitalea magnusonii]
MLAKALQPQGVGYHDVIERTKQRTKKGAAVLLQDRFWQAGCSLVKLVIHPLVVAGLQRKLCESVHRALLKTAR